MDIVIDWNGRELPKEMKELPAGRYVVVPFDPLGLTEEEDAELRQGLDSTGRADRRTG